MKRPMIALTLVATLFNGASSYALDTIRTHDETIRGRIGTMTPTAIEVQDRNSVRRKIAVNDIVAIRYDDEPDELGDARTQIRSGNLAEAKEMLRGVKIAQVTNPYVRSDIQFYYAYCVSQLAIGGSGTLDEAKKMMGQFIGANKNNYHYYQATEIYGDIAVAGEDYETALKAYGVLAQAPWPDAQLRAELARARVLQRQGSHPQALELYEKVRGAGLTGPQADRFRILATLGKASSLAESGQGDAGLELVESVIRSAEKGDTEVHALAYNAQGDCYRAMKNPKAAVLGYLHVDALYYQHPPLHAEALARIADLWHQMEKTEREASARKKLTSRYPNSKWARN